jgi:hypothetical protein
VGALAARLGPAEAAKLSAAAAAKALDALAKATDPHARAYLARAVGALAARLGPAEAAAAAAKAFDALAKETDPHARAYLARAVGSWDEDTIATSTRAFAQADLAEAVGSLAARIGPHEAAKLSAAATHKALDRMAETPHRKVPLQWSVAITVLGGRLSTEDLVDLLKHPACVGTGRTVLLRELGRRLGPPAPSAAPLPVGAGALLPAAPLAAAAGVALGVSVYPGGRRPFADRWEAVDALRARHPELDLANPPRRAGR